MSRQVAAPARVGPWAAAAGGALVWAVAGFVLPPTMVLGIFALIPVAALLLRAEPDATTLLTAYLVALFVLPARLVLQPVGGAGTPANIIAVGLLAVWAVTHISPGTRSPRGRQPLRIATYLVGAAVIASQVAGFAVGMTPSMQRASDRGLLVLAAGLGILLVSADGITSRARLDRLLERLVVLASIVAGVGILQYVIHLDIGPPFEAVPLLHPVSDLTFIRAKSDLQRVAGTALHPIEFGTMLAMVWPFAVHFALHRPERSALRRWLPVVLITVAIPMTASRSALIGLVIDVVIVSVSWPTAFRLRAILGTIAGLSVIELWAHTLLTDITHLMLLLTSGQDPSVVARTSDYEIARGLFRASPWFGRGIYTVTDGLVFDNEYLKLLVETGIVGTATVVVLFLTGWRQARSVVKRSDSAEERSLARSMTAAIVVAAVTFGFVDALHFPMMWGVAFVVLGAAAALWRIQRDERQAAGGAGPARAARAT